MVKRVILIIMSVLIILLIIGFILVKNFAFKAVVLQERQTKEKILEHMLKNFDSDYEVYKDRPFEELEIKSEDGLNLKGYYYNMNPESNKAVIINHGYTANHYVSLQFSDIFIELGYNVLLIDMRSHGESEGTYATYGFMEQKDLGLWVDLIKQRLGENAIIGLQGQSMGAATSLLYAGNNPNKVNFVIADCGYSNAKDALEFQFEQVGVPFKLFYPFLRNDIKNKCGFDIEKISPLEAIKNSDIPTMFIAGTKDEIVPYTMSQEMFKQKNGKYDELLIVDDAIHVGSFAKDKEVYFKKVSLFIEKAVSKS